jgi:hypothetical protein
MLHTTEATISLIRGRWALYRFLREISEQEARDHDLPILTVDGSLGVSEMLEAVDQLLGEACCARSTRHSPTRSVVTMRNPDGR